MSTPENYQTPWYGSSKGWSKIFAGTGAGAATAMQGASALAQSKKEALEAKRRTLANLLNSSLKKGQGLFRMGQEYNDDAADFRSQSMQQVARGFVDALKDSTGKGYR